MSDLDNNNAVKNNNQTNVNNISSFGFDKISIKKIIRFFSKMLLYTILTLLLALLIRLFLCDFYRVPSNSMAPTVIPGDFILAEKLTYGARIFTNLKFDTYHDPPMKRVQGISHIHRGDVVVFNFPYPDYNTAWDTIRMNLNMFFVKRCIGLPGDSLSVINSFYHIAGLTDTVGYIPGQKQLASFGLNIDSALLYTIPFDSMFQWNAVNFGPLYIPAEGTTIPLSPENYILYHKQIVYETNSFVEIKDSFVYIDNTLFRDYTFRSNWYFMAGDNAIGSQDSRYIGLIPEAYIVGKASVIMSSKDMSAGKRRWKRTMKQIK